MSETTDEPRTESQLAASGYAGVDWRPASEMPRSKYMEAWYAFAPGMMLRRPSGEVVLIGHANDLGGGCDCCGVIDDQVSSGEIAAWAWSPGWEPHNAATGAPDS